MRVVIAVRVSPRPAENVRYSPQMQEEGCRRWATDHGHEVVGVVSDILVSGGSRTRFDSILRALDEWKPDAFLVLDLSRWTRDTPTRFYAMRAILEDANVSLLSVMEPFVGSDQPFSDTITTAIVESNLQQRLVANRKTADGLRQAWASGKRWGKALGWTFDGHGWVVDTELIRAFYHDWIAGTSTLDMSLRYGIALTSVAKSIRARRQREVVGDETWLLAQSARRDRQPRYDARYGNVYRGLLTCPFCGHTMQHSTACWGQYRCPNWYRETHGWTVISARRHVTPVVRDIISRVVLPEVPAEAPRKAATPRKGIGANRDRLTVAWAAGRLSDERYEKELARLDAEERRVVTVPIERARTVVREMVAMSPVLDCTGWGKRPCRCVACPRERVTGGLVNGVLRALLDRIEVTEDRHAIVHVRPEYEMYLRSA